jgi:hypothetical protein
MRTIAIVESRAMAPNGRPDYRVSLVYPPCAAASLPNLGIAPLLSGNKMASGQINQYAIERYRFL